MGQTQSLQVPEGMSKGKLLLAANTLKLKRAAASASEGQRSSGDPLPPAGAACFPGEAFHPHLSGPPLSPCEAERVACAESLGLIGSPPSVELGNILQLVCSIFGTRSALIGLFGDMRIWVKDAHNFELGDFPWRKSFCAWTLSSPEPQALIVRDAHADARFHDHEYVKAGAIGFYAGIPLVASNGHRLGTLCCADPSPREFDERQCQILANFASVVAKELEKAVFVPAHRQRGHTLAARAADAAPLAPEPERGIDFSYDSMLCVDAAADGKPWVVVHANTAAEEVLGVPCQDLLGRQLWSLFEVPGGAGAALAAQRGVRQAASQGSPFFVSRAASLERPGEHYDMFFKPVDQACPWLTIPTYIPDAPATCAATSQFFVTLHRCTNEDGSGGSPSAGASPTASSSASGSGGSSPLPAKSVGSGGRDSTSGGGMVRSAGPGARAACAIKGLKLGVQIACGSYGRVYRGSYFGTKVAVKVLESEAVTRRDPATGASLEAVLSRGLCHPNIVQTLAWKEVRGQARAPRASNELVGESMSPAVGPKQPPRAPAGAHLPFEEHQHEAQDQDQEQDAQTWMVLEFCDKGCLQDAVDQGWLRSAPSYLSGRVDIAMVMVTAAEIAAPMAYLHSLDLVHGDLSAFNVMLTSQGAAAGALGRGFTAKIADFGLARSMDHSSRIETRTYGTLAYMAPEVLEHNIVSKAADVYSFGVLLWQMCEGSRPWAGMSHCAIVRAVCSGERQLQFGDHTPDVIQTLALACLSHEPRDRPTFDDIIDVLGPVAAALRAQWEEEQEE